MQGFVGLFKFTRQHTTVFNREAESFDFSVVQVGSRLPISAFIIRRYDVVPAVKCGEIVGLIILLSLKLKRGLNMKENISLPALINRIACSCRVLVLFGLLILALPSAVYAHRGASNEIDACNILVGHERVHFTAYTPTFNNKEYCQSIPHLGTTNLVFDYGGKGLRNLTVEFEVTKEPEGTRVFYLEPTKIKSGTVNGTVDFNKFGAGNYLIHVAIVHKDKSIDNHIPLSIGLEPEASDNLPLKALFIVTLIAAAIYFMKRLADKDAPRPSDV
jgi:hypothetical protein